MEMKLKNGMHDVSFFFCISGATWAATGEYLTPICVFIDGSYSIALEAIFGQKSKDLMCC